MITLQTITTIELSNECNLSCRYCIHRLMHKEPTRELGIMSDEVFERSLRWLKALCERGTQGTINLNGNGESCLDPRLPERIRSVKDVMGYGAVNMCTNGVNLTEEMAIKIRDAGIDQFDVSPHSPFHARRAVQIMRKAGLRGIVNFGTIMQPHNWAGQIEPQNCVDEVAKIPCVPLIEGRGYIQKEGNVSPCCYDFRNLGTFGTVFDDDLLEKEIRPFVLCQRCHQVIPEEVLSEVMYVPERATYMIRDGVRVALP